MPSSRLLKLLEMLQNQPNDPFLIYAVGFEYENAGNIADAMVQYGQILKDHPDYLPVYYQAGMLYHQMGNTPEAIKLLEKGCELAMSQKEQKTLRELKQALEDIEDE